MPRAAFTVTTRLTGRTEKASADALDGALTLVAAAVTEHGGARRGTARAFVREVAPGDQVVARIELRGPGVRGGVDVRGDGTAVAWTGRWTRRLVDPDGAHPRETAAQALRRALEG